MSAELTHASEAMYNPELVCPYCLRSLVVPDMDIKGMTTGEMWDAVAIASARGMLDGWTTRRKENGDRYIICPTCDAQHRVAEDSGTDPALMAFEPNPVCSKCLSTKIDRWYCIGGLETEGCQAHQRYHSEHLHYDCTQCGFKWETRTAGVHGVGARRASATSNPVSPGNGLGSTADAGTINDATRRASWWRSIFRRRSKDAPSGVERMTEALAHPQLSGPLYRTLT